MKKGNKLVALLLTLLLAFSVSGCGDAKEKDTTNELIGSWSMECDFAEGMNAAMGEEYANMETEFVVKLIFEFTQEGTYKMYVDKDSFVASFDGWLNDYVASTVEDMYVAFAEEGLSKEDADLIIEQEYGCSISEYLYDATKEQLDLDAMVEDMVSEGIYEVKGEKVHMSDGAVIQENRYYIYQIEGNTLTLNIPEGVEVQAVFPGMEYPFILTKETQ